MLSRVLIIAMVSSGYSFGRNEANDCASIDSVSTLQTVASVSAPTEQNLSIVINEVYVRPLDGESEFVEVYNSGIHTVDISGWTVADAAGHMGTWSSTILEEGAVAVAEFSRKLNNDGDTVTLTTSDGNVVDSFRFGSSAEGQSWNRIPDGGLWSNESGAPTRGALNIDPLASVVINEVVPKPADGGSEFVEVYNGGVRSVDVSGWTLTDAVGYKATWNGTSIDAGSVVVAVFSQKLNNGGDTVTLKTADGKELDSFSYASSIDGKSWSRQPDGGAWNTRPQVPTQGRLNGPPRPTLPRPSLGGSPCGGKCDDGLCFGTWNIQNLGQAKEGRPAVMDAIRSVVARYDLLAVQELSQYPRPPYVCGPFTEKVICDSRPDPSAFTVTASPRIADEQYVLIGRDQAVSVVGGGATYPDVMQIHARSPHAFNVTVKKGSVNPWQLVVGVTHTQPTRATEEILNFHNVLAWMRTEFTSSHRTHYMMVGDYNSDGSYFRDDAIWGASKLHDDMEGYSLLTGNDMDSTVAASSNAYDRIITDNVLADTADTPHVFRLEDLDLSVVRAEGCELGYVSSSVCDAELDGVAWADIPDEVRTELAKELSDHHPVEICFRS
eukprot:TRINITY_DN68090_c0_g1_i1.p1 TRINITY_DN68090_c0_g1~~TRINITY_DN68090_c0_g1_i1.p1  ORF type:complete len:609 (+),score=93.62 TRINITY_DN68090_c0_g1_i1:258-2084(+)